MGKLNNYAGLFSLAILGILLYSMFVKKDDDSTGNFLGYSVKRKRK